MTDTNPWHSAWAQNQAPTSPPRWDQRPADPAAAQWAQPPADPAGAQWAQPPADPAGARWTQPPAAPTGPPQWGQQPPQAAAPPAPGAGWSAGPTTGWSSAGWDQTAAGGPFAQPAPVRPAPKRGGNGLKVGLIIGGVVVAGMITVGVWFARGVVNAVPGGLETLTGELQPGHSYGDNPTLDGLWDGCVAGDFGACDELFFTSEAGSEYEHFGDSCGGRNEPAGLCTTIYGQ